MSGLIQRLTTVSLCNWQLIAASVAYDPTVMLARVCVWRCLKRLFQGVTKDAADLLYKRSAAADSDGRGASFVDCDARHCCKHSVY